MPSTVILGTGIIGLSTAYYLSQLAESGAAENDSDTTPTANDPSAGREKHEIHLVEPAPELFASASGKAAGFLAKDWFAPPVAPLGEFSFELHRRLAKEHGGRERWGWSESVSYSLDREESESPSEGEDGEDEEEDEDDGDEAAGASERKKARNDLDWLMSGSSRATLLDTQRPEAASEAAAEYGVAGDANPDEDNEEHPQWVRASQNAMQMISDRTSTGQVDPYRLCQFLLQECLARGVKLHQPARATQLLAESASGSPGRTLIRLQYLGPDPEAVFTTAGTPNSMSPPSDPANGGHNPNPNNGTLLSARPYGDPRSSSAETNRDDWQSFSSPLDAEGTPLPQVNPLGEYYVNHDASANRGSEKSTHDGTYTLDVPCDSLVITAGCWTPRVYRSLFPNAGRIPRVTALAGHSVVVKSRKWMSNKARRKLQAKLAAGALGDAPQEGIPTTTSPSAESTMSTSSTASAATTGRVSPTLSIFSRSSSYSSITTSSPSTSPPALPHSYPQPPYPGVTHAIFTSDRARYSPEIFSRLSGDVWLGGLNSSNIPLPPLPTMARVDPTAIDKLMHTAGALLGSADLGDGVRVPGGVFVATGHGPWGISLALGTGWVVGEMVLGREPSVDVATLGTWEAGVS
ncbi:hypothetical protein PHLGIDRAFT_113391 [Phlebiopsis gigantea 11061_1 CR5-6]|uniref:FAD dependent oxidoreductase domain-containing protein n=1 Tax=Phlebiopsis gigantea (strain 11061_1 CR5-6) TaxID=745531 RepID=A0A0C3SEK0_PHLG1|nr:hypothetical protein PHLGIDRAFT_113391 [Phlebiopsis gigantea 11061_1 CR5-6]